MCNLIHVMILELEKIMVGLGAITSTCLAGRCCFILWKFYFQVVLKDRINGCFVK